MIKKITVGLVAYNSSKVISRALYPLCRKYPIIIVDNKSNDNTVLTVNKACPHTKLIRSNVNLGYAKACNIILRSAQSKYVLLINPDVRICASAIMHLVDIAEQNDKALILAPILMYPDGRIQNSFLPFIKNINEYLKPLSVEHVIAAAILLRRNEILSIGGFDENYFIYGEDEDLCFRVRKERMKIMIVPKAIAIHIYGSSSNAPQYLELNKSRQLSWSRLRYFNKNYGCLAMLYNAIRILMLNSTILLLRLFQGKSCDAKIRWARMRGVIDYLLVRQIKIV